MSFSRIFDWCWLLKDTCSRRALFFWSSAADKGRWILLSFSFFICVTTLATDTAFWWEKHELVKGHLTSLHPAIVTYNYSEITLICSEQASNNPQIVWTLCSRTHQVHIISPLHNFWREARDSLWSGTRCPLHCYFCPAFQENISYSSLYLSRTNTENHFANCLFSLGGFTGWFS